MAEQPPSWVSWQGYVDRIHDLIRDEHERDLEAFRQQMQERFSAQQQAVQAYAESNQRALERLNELRQAFNDQTTRFVTHEALKVLEVKLTTHADRLGLLENQAANLAGKAEQATSGAKMMIAVVSVVLLLVQVALHLLWR